MAGELKNAVDAASKAALKQRKKPEVAALRLILAAFKQYEVDSRTELDDPTALTILAKLAKQRRESISQYSTAGRDDLVAQEEFELDIIESYLPAALSEAEINTAIDTAIANVAAASIKDMGKVMGQLKTSLQGRADLALVSAAVKQRLTN